MPIETIPWDAAEHLDDEESIAAYLAEVIEMGDPAHIVHALGTVARARGVTWIALGWAWPSGILQIAGSG